MNTRTCQAGLLLALLALLAPVTGQSPADSAAGDRVVLKSGTVLTGRITGQTVERVTFTTLDGKSADHPRTRIRALLPGGTDCGIYGVRPPARSGEAPKSHIRCLPGSKKEGTQGTLSTGVTRWFHRESETTLFLVGAVHIGEQAYYDRIQAILDQTDVVLFEAVKKGDREISDEELASMSALHKMQMAMKDALGLEHQKAAMNYEREFWKNADVDWGTLQDHMKENRTGLPTDNPLIRTLLGWVASAMSKASENRGAHDYLRRQMAPVLAKADQILASRMKNVGDSLIVFRNERAMEFVRAELKGGAQGRWLSLFYGAAHLPDLARRLQEDGWQFQGTDWIPAWRFTGR